MKNKNEINTKITALTKKVKILQKAWKFQREQGNTDSSNVFLNASCEKEAQIQILKWALKK